MDGTFRRSVRWIVVVGLGELVGFLVPATAGVLWSAREWGFAAIVAAGAVEGAVLGLSQWSVMREDMPALPVRAWAGATAAGAVVAYALGMLPSTTATAWAAWPMAGRVAVAIPLLLALLLSIGLAQWLVLRSFIAHAWWWIVGTAIGWVVGLAVFFLVAPPLWREGQSVSVALLISVLAGALMAAAMAAVTGFTWLRLLKSQRRRRRQDDLAMV